MKRRFALLGLVALGATACGDIVDPVQQAAPAAAFAALGPGSEIIPGRFIVTLRPGVSAADVAARFGIQRTFTYTAALNGFAASLSDLAVSGLLADSRVAAIEPDQVMRASAVTQTGATWGIDRSDQRDLPLSTTFTYTNTGTGVNAYIIDTGIRFTHTEFGGRAVTGFDAVTAGGTALDCNGHGTHVAGTTGGASYGIAKGVKLFAVRVLACNGSGTTSGVIAGVDWVTNNHVKPAVANMSLGGGASTALDNAVKASIAAGVGYAIAAGNGNIFGLAENACNKSPARVPEAMTISATNNTDTKPGWANIGPCVDWFAPGVGITSAWFENDTQIKTISGTSMSTPHVAGVAAQYLQSNPAATPLNVADALRALTTPGKVKSPGTNSPNKLLFTNF